MEICSKDLGNMFIPSMTAEEFNDMTESNEGFCIKCGENAYGVEPDARKYTCEYCETNNVYGLSELLIMDLLIIENEEE